jgi:HD-GYP domain-containing protein (c-di-GMP phosphodiesterase class II)
MGGESNSDHSTPSQVRLEGSAGVQRLLSHFRPRLTVRMAKGELRAEMLVASAFLVVAVGLAALVPGRASGSSGVALLFTALYAVTSRIEFDVAAGYGMPTQLVLVPMLFAVPPGWVPLLVAGGLVLGKLPLILDGRRSADRLVVMLADAWHAVGPAAVFSLAHLGAPSWPDAPVLLLALLAQFGCDFTATVAREWLRLGELPRLSVRLIGAVYFTDLCLSPIGFAVAFAAADHPAAALIVLPLGALLTFFARDRRARMAAAVELSRAYRGTALLLGDVVEADDAYTGSHSRDVVDLVMAVAPRMGLNEDQLRNLEFAALLHDVGKIAIPNEIINKPGPLNDEERAIINTHTLEGEKMLENVGGVLAQVGRIVRSCHERYDGLGYPDGLAGSAIPVEARIVACCDAFNAMTTDRPYRAALPLSEALGELHAHRGTQFDPAVVDVLVAIHDEMEVSAAESAGAARALSAP